MSTAPTSPRRSRRLNPETTLFIIASKTFTTQETMTNAHTRRDWFLAQAGDAAARGEALCRHLDQPDGGGSLRHRSGQHVRLLGLGRRPLLAVVGHRAVHRLLRSASTTSRSCSPAPTTWTGTSAKTPFERNLPVILALLGIWYNNFFGAETRGHPALRPVHAPLPGLLPAGQHGEQRQIDRPQRTAGRLRRPDRSSGASPAPTASTPSTS